MELVIKVAKIDKDAFGVQVNKDNYNVILKLLQEQRINIINKLKEYNATGLIGTIKYPRNKYIQPELDTLVERKRVINNSIEQINKLFK